MTSKRILIVDDSCLCQRVLTEVIDSHDQLEVVGVAGNGKIALEMIDKLEPDLVTLDILMPELDGVQTLIELRKRWPHLKTIMTSSLTSEGSDAALDALSLGASDYSLKPLSSAGVNSMKTDFQAELVPKIEALCGIDMVHIPDTLAAIPTLKTTDVHHPQTCTDRRPEIVAIGVSTGGPDALARVLGQLPPTFQVPVVIVQHMPAEFTEKLAKRLNTCCALNVAEAKVGDKIKAGNVYIAPGDFHMVLDKISTDVIVNLNRDEHENSCRPSVNPLFRSLPAIYGDQVLAVIMTGMGSDGLNGCEAVSRAGGSIIVQDKPTSVVWGMPRLVATAGLAEEVLPLDQIANALIARVQGSAAVAGKTTLQDRHAANSDSYGQQRSSGERK